MSFFVRSVLPIGFAIGFGVWNAYYAFDPIFKEQRDKKNDPAMSNDNQQPPASVPEKPKQQ